jgi:DNA-directed RNA polymerase subunit RPC12/RpoP
VFCNKCGRTITDMQVVCDSCGSAVIVATTPRYVSRTPVADKHAKLRAERPDLQGVSGWLGFFAWTNLVVAPVIYFVQSGFPPKFWITWFLSGANRAYGALAGYLIVEQSPLALINARVHLAIQLAIYSSLALLELSAGEIPGRVSLRLILYSVVWQLYFFRSRRVKLTLDSPR